MSNHKGTIGTCQDHAHPSRVGKTPPPLSHELDADEQIDWRLVHRYGAHLLTGGYTALPTYAWVYYARLGVSEAEFVYIQQLCTYWWSTRDPFPGDAAIAARMGKTVRCIQGYSRSLVAKGLLHIQAQYSAHGRQQSNAYDLRPFFAAVEGLARLDGLLADPADVTPAPAPVPPALDTDRDRRPQPPHAGGNEDGANAGRLGGPGHERAQPHPSAEQDPLCVGATGGEPDTRQRDTDPLAMEEGEGLHGGRAKNPSPQVNPIEEDPFDFDSIPPTPTETARTTRADDRRATGNGGPDDQALAQRIADLSSEFGDDAPASSLTRARSLGCTASVPPARLLQLLDEAAARTRARQAHIVKRRRDGQAPNGMPYLFAVLQDLLHPRRPRGAAVGSPPDRRRARQPGRRRRPHEGGRGETAGSDAAWSDSPDRLPIVEEHPVWRAALDELAQVMTSENFNTWLATTRALGQEGEVLRVAVPAAFNKTWLDTKLAGKVAGALHKIDYGACGAERVGRVEYVVAAAA